MDWNAIGLGQRLDVSALKQAFKRDRRVRIHDFLDPEVAAALHANLRARTDWLQHINQGDVLYELDRDVRQTMEPAQADALNDAVYASARAGFQFRFEAIRVPDEASAREASEDPLAAFASFMSSAPVIAMLREVTGAAQITFADAQGTAYSPGDFLTGHDDAVNGKNRHAAYVLGLTPHWRLEWGGLLLFHSHDGQVSHGGVPTFNTLDLFSVPQMHSVAEVTRAAAYRRYSVTGWLRS